MINATFGRRIIDQTYTRRKNLKRSSRFGCSFAVAGLILGVSVASNANATPVATTIANPVERYRGFITEDINRALAGAKALRDRLAANDVSGARQTWIDSRVGWERSEVFTGGFAPDLDNAIDAWPDGKTGFHAIEAKLFGSDPNGALAQTDELVARLNELDQRLTTIDLTRQGLLNGVAGLAYEVGESKIDGGESRYSGTSLNDMRNNADGIDLAYHTLFASSLEASDPRLADSMESQIKKLKTDLDVSSLTNIDPDKMRRMSEDMVVTLQSAAPKLGLAQPSVEEGSPAPAPAAH
jgi:iron uptake system component EfeO